MAEQTAISKRQMELAEKQDRLIQAELIRKSQLKLEFLTPDGEGPEKKILIAVRNIGTKVAREFYWNLLIPVGPDHWMRVERVDLPLRNEDYVVVNPDRYRRSGGFVNTPLYPDRVILCAVLVLNEGPGIKAFRNFRETRLLWQISTEDGPFPNADGYSVISVDPPNNAIADFKPREVQ
jgi:hypothetical protein